MDKKRLLFMDFIGIPIVFLTAVILHFVYNLSGGAVWSILVGSVNESVWEHTKTFTIPYIIYTIFELMVIKLPFKRFVVSKVVGLYFIVFFIIVFFYTYIGLTSRQNSTIDILISFIAVLIAFELSYVLLTNFNFLEKYFTISVLFLTAFLIMYLLFTIKPPHIDIFLDPKTFNYGIPIYQYQNTEYYPNARKI